MGDLEEDDLGRVKSAEKKNGRTGMETGTPLLGVLLPMGEKRTSANREGKSSGVNEYGRD